MSAQEIHALHYATGKPVRVIVGNDKIESITEVTEAPEKEIWIAPPLVDLQINGYAGVDFQQDSISTENLWHAARGLRRDGCAHFLLTLITDEWSRLLARLSRLKK